MFETKVDLRRFEKEVLAYEAQPIETGKILFVGSSGFTRWQPKWGNRRLEDDIRMKDGSPAAINHGIGGSTTEEILYYYDRLVRPYKPRALVLRTFLNDRWAGYSPYEIMLFYSRIFAWARADFPGIKLYACDAAPIKKRIGDDCWLSNVKQFNAALKDYCDKHDDTTLICHIQHPGYFENPEDIGDYNKIRQDIFIEDEVHLTPEGYEIYRDMFLKALDDIL